MTFTHSKLVECKTCGIQIAQEVKSCPQCGALNFSVVNIVVFVALILLIFFFLTGGFGLL